MARKWLVPSKRKGQSLVPLQLKVKPAFKQALYEYSNQLSQEEAQKISAATVLISLALRGDVRLRRLYKRHSESDQ